MKSVLARTQTRDIATPTPDQPPRTFGAEAAFRARLAELGATLLEPAWRGAREPHRVRCAAGHECAPRPSSVQQGKGICLACVGRGGTTAWDAFRARVAELGGEVLEPVWLGHKRPHRVRCAAGHECTPWPSSLQQGRNLCKACSRDHPDHSPVALDRSRTAEAAFRARVAELGGVVLEPTWRGVGTPHRVRCAAGHECTPQPRNINYLGRGICRTCAGLGDPAAAWAAFRKQVTELGGEVLEPAWLGSKKPHRVRCAAGHECAPWPTRVQMGQGLCSTCVGIAWDVFYVVTDDEQGHLKFGITSGNPKPRLGTHRIQGYRTLVRLLVNLPGTMAPDLEHDVIATLRLAKERPIHGREYYGIHVLATVLDVVDNYPGAQDFTSEVTHA